MWLCANRFISRMPYSSEDMLRSVDTRQYCTISMPSKSAVLMLVFPMSRVSIMGTYSFENDSCFILRSASTTGVVIRALATASSEPAIRPVPPMSVSTFSELIPMIT